MKNQKPYSILTVLLLSSSFLEQARAETLGEHSTQQILSRVMDDPAPDVLKLFDYYSASTNTPSLWNPDFWASDLDFTGISWDTSQTATLISPRHVVFAAHWPTPIGSEVVFTNTSGQQFSYTVTQHKKIYISTGATDTTIGLLDRAVDLSLKYYKVADLYETPNAHDISSSLLINTLHNVANDHKREASIVLSNNNDPASFIFLANPFPPQVPSQYSAYVSSGSSGNPGFFLIHGELVLAFTYSTPYGGVSYSNDEVRSKINEAMILLSDETQDEYQLEMYDVSEFETFEEYCFGAAVSNMPFASSGVSQGTKNDPHLICTEKQFKEINNYLDDHFKLMKDISLPSSGNSYWAPIGSESAPFTGSLNGDNFTIFNIRALDTIGWSRGLFGVTRGALIKNLKLENANVNGSGNLGTLVGSADNGTVIRRVHSSGNVTGFSVDGEYVSNVGGLVGVLGESSKVYSSSFTGKVDFSENVQGSGAIESAGGLIGHMGRYTLCQGCKTFSASLDFFMGTARNIGGLVGSTFNAQIINSKAFSPGIRALTSAVNVGGLIGMSFVSWVSHSRVQKRSKDAVNAFWGKIWGTENVGGLIGFADFSHINKSFFSGEVWGMSLNSISDPTDQAKNIGGLIGNAYNRCSIEDSYAAGKISQPSGAYKATTKGGLVGLMSGGHIKRSYSRANVTRSGRKGGLVGVGAGFIVQDSFSVGRISGNNQGGILGKNTGNTEVVMTNTFYYSPNHKQERAVGIGIDSVGVVEEASLDVFQESSSHLVFSSWNFASIWKTNSIGKELPLLR